MSSDNCQVMCYLRDTYVMHVRTQPIPWRKGSLSGDECYPLEPVSCSKGQSEGIAVIPWALIPCQGTDRGWPGVGGPLAQGMGPLRVAPCPRGCAADARPLPRRWPGDAAGTDALARVTDQLVHHLENGAVLSRSLLCPY